MRIVLYVLAAFALFWGIWFAGYVMFNAGGEAPGDGYGDPAPALQQPPG